MAFALLANLPAVNGLYSSFFPLLPYFFLGSVHQMVPGNFTPLSRQGELDPEEGGAETEAQIPPAFSQSWGR